MKEWKQVTCCPYCGGELEVCEHYTFSRNYSITKKGVISNKFKCSSPGSMDCITVIAMDAMKYLTVMKLLLNMTEKFTSKLKRRNNYDIHRSN